MFDVMANDSDRDGDALQLLDVDMPAYGNVAIKRDGSAINRTLIIMVLILSHIWLATAGEQRRAVASKWSYGRERSAFDETRFSTDFSKQTDSDSGLGE